ncbi:MAG: CHAT domain-containing tetratricopeptide repeat protein [Bacteroidota bacterium]
MKSRIRALILFQECRSACSRLLLYAHVVGFAFWLILMFSQPAYLIAQSKGVQAKKPAGLSKGNRGVKQSLPKRKKTPVRYIEELEAELAGDTIKPNQIRPVYQKVKAAPAATTLPTIQVSQTATKSSLLPCDQFGDSLFNAANYLAASQRFSIMAAQAKRAGKADLFAALCVRHTEAMLRLGNLNGAEAQSTELKQEANTNPGPDSLMQGEAFYASGLVNLYRGRSEQAGSDFYSALRITNRNRGPNHVRIADIYNGLGLNAWNTQEQAQALMYFYQSLAIREANYGSGNPEVAAACNNLGLVFQQNEPDSALHWFTRADNIYRSIYKTGHPARLYTGINKAIAANSLGYTNRAEGELELLLTEINRSLGPRHPTAGFVKATLSGFLFERGNYERSKATATDALGIYLDACGNRHPETASLRLRLSEVAEKQNRPNDALAILQQAMVSASSNFESADVYLSPGPGEALNAMLMLELYRRKARLLETRYNLKTLNRKDLDASLLNLSLADSLLTRLRRLRTGNADKLTLGSASADVYAGALRICMQLAQVSARPAYYKKLAFRFCERSKAAVLQAAVAEASARRFAGIPDSVLEREQHLEAHVNLLEQKLAAAESPGILAALRLQLFVAAQSLQNLVQAMERKYPAYYDLKYRNPNPDPDKIRESLEPGTALLSYYLAPSDSKLYVFCITNKGLKAVVKTAGPAFYRSLNGLHNGIIYRDAQTFTLNARSLQKTLMPFRLPASVKQLVLIPDAQLLRIPFEALLTGSQKTGDSRRPTYLTEKYAIGYHYSATLYAQQHRDTSGMKGSGEGLLLFAPVSFEYDYGPNQPELPTLTSSGEEAEAIAFAFRQQGLPEKSYTAEFATESSLKKSGTEKYSFLHLATHGLADEEHPELSRIWLVPGDGEDGMLYSGEVYGLHLNTRLVTLSACETGLGAEVKGEGLIGLSRALLYAGAGHVVVSLWSVGDEGTKKLMSSLYTNLLRQNGNHTALALQRARIELIESKEFNEPFFWAAFVGVGR